MAAQPPGQLRPSSPAAGHGQNHPGRLGEPIRYAWSRPLLPPDQTSIAAGRVKGPEGGRRGTSRIQLPSADAVLSLIESRGWVQNDILRYPSPETGRDSNDPLELALREELR